MKLKPKYILYILLVTLVSLSSCTEKIDIELDSDRIRLVVDGIITDIPGEQYVKLTETADYFSNEQPKGVGNATVIIESQNGPILLTESDSVAGLYLMPDGFVGVQGNIYQLNIKLENEIGGYKDYFANTKMPLLSDDIDSIAVEWMPQFEGWVVRLYAQDPDREDFYMFNGLRNGELITDSIHEVNITDDRLFNGNYTSGVMVLMFNEDQLDPGDLFTLVLSNITKEYASFVTEVQIEIQPKEPLFSGPPANVSSNISNGATGWFTSYPSAFSSTIVQEIPEEK